MVNVASAISNLFGLGKKEPWMEVLRKTQFKNVDQTKLNTLFEFLAFCLKQVSVVQYFLKHWSYDMFIAPKEPIEAPSSSMIRKFLML